MIMKLFLDTANLKDIIEWNEAGIIDGITTNPTHLAKEGGDPRKQVIEICTFMEDKPVSVEVTESKPELVYQQAKEIALLADNIVVKIPCYKPYYSVINQLVQEGIPLNITLIFSVIQGMLMAKLGVKYISPFIGRLVDIDSDGISVISDLRVILDRFALLETEILAASIRTVSDVHDVAVLGADIATIPLDVLKKMTQHPLTDRGMEKFLEDWKKLDIKKFP